MYIINWCVASRYSIRNWNRLTEFGIREFMKMYEDEKAV